MTNFFDSDIVREALEEIHDLQSSLYKNVFMFEHMDIEEREEHIDKLSDLLEKQRIMYARLSLSDDPEAIKLKGHLQQSVALMGFPPETDMLLLFDGMQKTIENLRNKIDPK